MPLSEGTIAVYAGVKIRKALEELTGEMTMYHGVRLAQVIEAVYQQGIRNGRRSVVEAFQGLSETKELRYRNPGRPLKKPAKRIAKKIPAKKVPAKKVP